ncbi:ATP synthase F1 subunit gamma [Buchnera aphidicola (Neophyllaphis varicolor)]|uniref:ATP synthase F1 subunit gamma n=1 Tax=Buchnera aphidicola TaxID=9 RepID=UPI0031B864B0
MAIAKEIRTKIDSITSTAKITKAMEMVSASKMKKTQNKMQASRPYSKLILEIIKNLSEIKSEFNHIYFQNRTLKRIGIIIISTNRGLCGSLNYNLFKQILNFMNQYFKKKVEVDLIILGVKGIVFFEKLGMSIIKKIFKIDEKLEFSQVLNIISLFLEMYKSNNIDRIFLAHNFFKNAMIQIPKINQLLPICTDIKNKKYVKKRGYFYEPDDDISILNFLLNRYLESQLYQGILENAASEQAARMVAMKTASDNSNNLITELQLVYNKMRQSAITQEITEIISGASAI